MPARANTFALHGVDAVEIAVEADIHSGLPAFNIVGLPDTAVREARERVRAALLNSGFEFPMRRITVNLAPADLRKGGPAFDLALAGVLLAASGQIEPGALADRALCGELGLDGAVRPIRGALVIADAARHRGHRNLFLPAANEAEGAIGDNSGVVGVRTLAHLVECLAGDMLPASDPVDVSELFHGARAGDEDMSDVRGHQAIKRALEVAAAGGHNLLMIGSPGSGKSMLARRLPSILPPPTLDEALETTRVHSVAGLLGDGPLVPHRPFRAPHHTISAAGLVGGGSGPSAGEISLAHNGVLFLDELSEFSRPALQALRQPLEQGFVDVVRAQRCARFPARFMLVAATNPCPCGHYGDRRRECQCHPSLLARYAARLSGPLLDRIDIVVRVDRPGLAELSQEGRDSKAMRAAVEEARARQTRRLSGLDARCNADMSARQATQLARLDEEAQELLVAASQRLQLSMRGQDRALKVASTIADLAAAERVAREHVAEALAYRDPIKRRLGVAA